MRTTVERITPAIAARYLEGNVHNRPIRQIRVDELKRAILAGEWQLTHQGIAFAEDGMLVDGQHRLWAVLESAVESGVEIQVTRGVDAETFKVIDTGTARSTADTLAVSKEPYYAALAQGLTWLYREEQGHPHLTGGGGKASLSNTQVGELLAQHPAIRQSVRVPRDFKPALLMPRGIAIWLHYRFSQKDAQLAHQFFEGVGRGEALRQEDPRYVLRDRLLANAASKTGKLHGAVVAALTIKAWNAFAGHKNIRVLSWQRDQPWPEVGDVTAVKPRVLKKESA